MTYVINIEEVT